MGATSLSSVEMLAEAWKLQGQTEMTIHRQQCIYKTKAHKT